MNCSRWTIEFAKFVKCSHCRLEICIYCFILNEQLEHFHFNDDLQPTILDYEKLKMAEKQEVSKRRTAEQMLLDELEE